MEDELFKLREENCGLENDVKTRDGKNEDMKEENEQK